MGRESWFDVIGQGYEVSKDGFGYCRRAIHARSRAGRHRIEVGSKDHRPPPGPDDRREACLPKARSWAKA